MADLSKMGLDPEVPENTGAFTVLPAGQYEAVIVDGKLEPTKAGTGQMFVLGLQIIRGPQKGQTVIDRLNIINQNETAQKIGQGTLKRICSLTGQPYPPTDTRKMNGIPMIITVGVEEFISNTTGQPLKSNTVTAYASVKAPVAEVQAEQETEGW